VASIYGGIDEPREVVDIHEARFSASHYVNSTLSERMSGRSFSDSVCRSSTISALEIVLCLLIQTLVSRLLKASLSVIEFYSPPPFFPAGLSFGVKNSFGARRNRGSDGLLQTQTIQ